MIWRYFQKVLKSDSPYPDINVNVVSTRLLYVLREAVEKRFDNQHEAQSRRWLRKEISGALSLSAVHDLTSLLGCPRQSPSLAPVHSPPDHGD